MNNENQNTSVIPTTPETPVLPQDQALNVTASIPTQVEAVPVQPTINPAEAQGGIINEPAVPVQTTVAPPPPPMQTGTIPTVDVPTSVVASGIENGALVNGVDPSVGIKEGNQALPVEKKKKGGKVFLIFILLLILIAGIGAGVIYFTQYKNQEKRLDAIIDGLFSFTSTINNDSFEQKSGVYNLDTKIDFNNESYSAELDGSYAIDLTQSFDFTFNVKSLNLGGEILTTGPLATEVYLYDGNAYILLQNFYDNYIFTEFPNAKNVTDYINQNNINYVSTKNTIIKAFKTGIKSMGYGTTLENINGYKNVITVTINERTMKLFMENFMDVIYEDEDLTNQIAKALNKSKDELEKSVSRTIKNYTYEGNGSIRFVTGLFDKTLESITIRYKDEVININPTQKGYKLKVTEDSKSILDLEYTKTTKRTTSTDEKEISLSGTISSNIISSDNKNEVVYSYEINFKTVSDVAPTIEKVNVREAIRLDNLSNEDKLSIIDKINGFGRVSEILSSYEINLNEILGVEMQPENPEEVVQDEVTEQTE